MADDHILTKDNFDAFLCAGLDVRCYACNGSGQVNFEGGFLSLKDCDVCYGTGYQPTRAGLELLNFLRRQKKRIDRERV
jgi:excinuclease UvrABC ATPase subunit